MATEIYTNAAVDIRGQRLLEAATVEVTRQSNAIDQNTLAKGWAGKSPGARKMMIKITNGVRAAGIEYDPGPDILSLAGVAVTIWAASSFLTTVGIVNSDSFKKGVDQNASLEMDIEAEFAQWQAA